jgi:branched-chain amino acid transport system substrate-binding protein
MGRVKHSLAVVTGLLLLVTACAPPGAPGSSSAQKPTGPIKVGLMAPLTGFMAAPAGDMVNGWNLYLKVNGNKWAGREVVTIVEDDAGDPTTALTKARQLIEQQQVDMIVGPLFAHVGLALADYVKTTGTPNFHPIIAADDLTQRHPVENVIRVAGWTSSQPQHPFGEWAYDQGYRKVMGIFADSAHGHESSGGFNRTFTARGGQIVKQLWPPLNTPDFSSYLAQIPDSGADAVATQVGGADAIRFVKQWSEFGLKGKVALLASEVSLDQGVLRGMGPEAEGLISVGHWAEGRPDKTTQDFVEVYLKEYNQLPSYFVPALYTAAQSIQMAVEKMNGDISNRKAFLDAVASAEIDGPMGRLKLDSYGNPNQSIYIRRVERRPDGRLWNVPIQTYENVSQFWTIGPEKFLKQPVYSREFQGLPEQLSTLGLQ